MYVTHIADFRPRLPPEKKIVAKVFWNNKTSSADFE